MNPFIDDTLDLLQKRGLIQSEIQRKYSLNDDCMMYLFVLWTGEALTYTEAEVELWLKGCTDTMFMMRKKAETP